jgi:Domain of Unknown Function (DUF1080)
MKKSPLFLALFTFAALISCQDTPSVGTTSTGGDEGFIELFDGKSLAGWTPSPENPASFSVADGELIVKGDRCHLFYTGETNGAKFKDFELKVRAKTFPGSNSGIYFHTAMQDEGWPNLGYECQVNSTHKDPKKTGSLYGVRNIVVLAEGQAVPAGGESEVRETAPSKDGEWFDYHIIVQGQRIILKVNGETTVDYTQPVGEAPDAKNPGRQLAEGTFAIQAHDPESEVHYQRFAVKPL